VPAAGQSGALQLAADPGGQLKFDKSSLNATAGKVTIAFVNRSPVPHDVTIEQGARKLTGSPVITSSMTSVSAQLKPGAYTFYCSVDAHRQAGMQGTLTVR
jgi:plastocyanin